MASWDTSRWLEIVCASEAEIGDVVLRRVERGAQGVWYQVRLLKNAREVGRQKEILV
jgi:hypothetical protein